MYSKSGRSASAAILPDMSSFIRITRPGYRLVGMTAPDEGLKAAQVASLKEEHQDLARKKEDAAAKKKVEELDALTKKKDDADKKQFKKGQDDLEKALGF